MPLDACIFEDVEEHIERQRAVRGRVAVTLKGAGAERLSAAVAALSNVR